VSRPADDDPALQVSVLGPLRLTVEGLTIDVPGTKRRAVLAMLAMSAPDAISADRLVDAVWPNDPPASGRAALQSHISRLRRHLGPQAPRLTSTGPGYRLDLDADALDAAVAMNRIREARSQAEQDAHAARESLAGARALWRGPALADLLDTAPLAAWARLFRPHPARAVEEQRDRRHVRDVRVVGAGGCLKRFDPVGLFGRQ
jgi:DNA-binding SARP family transcriptional activator